MTRITKTNFKQALINSGGNQSRIAEKMEVTRSAVNIFLKRHPDMREALEEQINLLYDTAQDSQAMQILAHKNVDESKWLLMNTKRGRERGFGNKTEIEHSGSIQGAIFNEVIKSNEEIKEMKNGKTNNSKPKAK